MKINFSEIQFMNLEDKDIVKDLYKTVAVTLWRYAKDLDLIDAARKIHRCEEVDLDKSELKEVLDILDDPRAGVLAFARKAIRDFVDEKVAGKKEADKKSS